MEKRDLKADLDWMMNAPSDHAKELEIAVHALERAMEAEALVRELVDAFDTAIGAVDSTHERQTDKFYTLGSWKRLLAKAKEVLGYGSQTRPKV